MDSKKHPTSKKLHMGRHPGEASADKYPAGALPAGNPLPQPDQGASMDPSMSNTPGM